MRVLSISKNIHSVCWLLTKGILSSIPEQPAFHLSSSRLSNYHFGMAAQGYFPCSQGRGRGNRQEERVDQRPGQKRKHDLPKMFDKIVHIQSSDAEVDHSKHGRNSANSEKKTFPTVTTPQQRYSLERNQTFNFQGNEVRQAATRGRGYSRAYVGEGFNRERRNFEEPRPNSYYSHPNHPRGRGRGTPQIAFDRSGRDQQTFQNQNVDRNSRHQSSFPNRRSNANSKDLFHLSKTMSYLLRHGIRAAGLSMESDGFVLVKDLLLVKPLCGRFTEDDVRRVVEENDKQRFQMKVDPRSNGLMVKANQGHTIQVPDIDLQPIVDPEEVPVVIHGTYLNVLEKIKHQGLSRMSRNHIHFSAGRPGDDGVLSGFRRDCQVLIHIDIQKALKDGLKFYRSPNNVILSPGDDSGLILPIYFKHVEYRITGNKGQKAARSSSTGQGAGEETWKHCNDQLLLYLTNQFVNFNYSLTFGYYLIFVAIFLFAAWFWIY